jgi:hypothetical protein
LFFLVKTIGDLNSSLAIARFLCHSTFLGLFDTFSGNGAANMDKIVGTVRVGERNGRLAGDSWW